MNKALSLIWILIFLIPAAGFSGNPNKRVEKHFSRAESYLRKKDYLRAIPHLRECYNLKPEEAKYAYMLGKCYVYTNRTYESLPYFSSAYRNNPAVDPALEFYLGKALHANQRFDKAAEHLDAYIINAESNSSHLGDAMAMVEMCNSAKTMMNDEKNFKIENLGEFVNSRYPEYAPSFSDHYTWMTFTSRRPRDLRKLLYGLNMYEDIDEEIYHSSFYDGTWAMTKLFRKPVSRFRHDASVFSSEDGNTIIFFVDKNNGDLYIVERDGNTWTKPAPIGADINSPSREPSVFLSPDGNTIYFSSDRPGGQGGLDLYMTQRSSEGGWSEAMNLGPEVNSMMDEDAPFLTVDGKTLYFSSRGHNTMGGFDVFKVNVNPGGTFGKPENLGYPINSVGDDIYYVERSDNKGFFLSSDRQGGFGGMDIYSGYGYTPDPILTELVGQLFDSLNNKGVSGKVRILDPKTGNLITEANTDANGNYKVNVPGGKNSQYKMEFRFAGERPRPAAKAIIGKENLLMGMVMDGVTGDPLTASIELIDSETGQVLDNSISNPRSGRYFLPVKSGKDYQLRVKSPNYISYFEDFKVTASGVIEAHSLVIDLQPLTEDNRIILNWQFFDYGKWELKNLYSDDLQNLLVVMEKVPVLRLKIVGHTDWDGSQSYNQKLSEKRAQAVANYLINKGVDPSRFEVMGMGEAQPLYDNKNEKLKPWNRRVELFIIN